MKAQTILLFGGTGFVGKYVVSQLAHAGFRLNIITRDVVTAAHLKTQGDVGQINLQYGDIRKASTYENLLANTDIVVNLVGLLSEHGAQNFENIHHIATARLAELSAKHGVNRFIHMSSLGVERAVTSKYAQTKLKGEQAVLKYFPNAVIFRPSVIFGIEDNFYNQFAKMSALAHVLPLIAGGKTKFQPTYVADVAEAFAVAASNNLHGREIAGIYELGGTEIMSFKQILEFIIATTNNKAIMIPLPTCAAKMVGFVNEFLPKPMITRDQVELLRYDNVVNENALGYDDLGIKPHSPTAIVPQYLTIRRKH